MKLEEKLARLRKEKGLSQLKVSERLGVSRQAISRWEVGAAMPSTENLKRLSDLYGVSADYLLHDDSERPAPEASRQEAPEGGDSMKKRWKPFVKLGAKMAVPQEGNLEQAEATDAGSTPEKFTARALWSAAAAVLLIFVLFAAQTGEETILAASVKSGASAAQPEAESAAAAKNPVVLGKADFTLDVAAADSVESPDVYETDSEKLRVKLKSPKHITLVVKVSLYDAAGQYLAGTTKEIGAVRSAEWTFTGLAPHGKYYFKIENLDQRDAVLKGTAASI